MTSPDSPSLSRGTPEMDKRDADVLLDQFANALYMHRNDESPKDAVAGCEICGRVRRRIVELIVRENPANV